MAEDLVMRVYGEMRNRVARLTQLLLTPHSNPREIIAARQAVCDYRRSPEFENMMAGYGKLIWTMPSDASDKNPYADCFIRMMFLFGEVELEQRLYDLELVRDTTRDPFYTSSGLSTFMDIWKLHLEDVERAYSGSSVSV